ncbi:MAG: septal ring factor EnvC (AmiA/AmiB activator) [Phenylobacterium sp.]|jgi:septal ring factor EnvC (AmiA/AmiB activator)
MTGFYAFTVVLKPRPVTQNYVLRCPFGTIKTNCLHDGTTAFKVRVVALMTETTVTAKQFISFETVSAILFSLFIGVCAWAWSSVDDRFEKVDQRFEKVDQRFEKVESKQDAMMVMLTRIEAQMATKDDIIKIHERISTNEKNIGIISAKVDLLIDKMAAN